MRHYFVALLLLTGLKSVNAQVNFDAYKAGARTQDALIEVNTQVNQSQSAAPVVRQTPCETFEQRVIDIIRQKGIVKKELRKAKLKNNNKRIQKLMIDLEYWEEQLAEIKKIQNGQ